MKRKNTKKLIAIPIVLIAIFILFMNPNISDFTNLLGTQSFKSNDISDGPFSSTGAMYQLAFTDTTNHLYVCENTSELWVFQNGAYRLIDSRADTFNTYVQASVTSNSNQQIIEKFRIDNYVKCDLPNQFVQKLTVEGFTNYQILTGETNLKIIASKSVPIPLKTLPDNVRVKVSQFEFTADSIENQLIVNSNGNGWIKANSLHSGTYTLVLTDGSKQISNTKSGVQSQVRHYISIEPDAEPIVDDQSRQNALIRIEKVTQVLNNKDIITSTQRTGTLDTEDGQQIRINAVMRDYRETDGLPQVKITGPSFSVNINLIHTGYENEVDGLFSNTFLLPRNVLGDYTIKMSHPLRSGTSEVTFKVVDSTPIVNPTDPTNPPITDIDYTPGIKVKAETKFHYIHRYDKVPECQRLNGEDICKLVQKTTSGVSEPHFLELNSLTDSINFGGQTGVEAVLEEIQLTSVVTADWEILRTFKEAVDSSTVYSATLTVGSQEFTFEPFTVSLPQKNICSGTTSSSQCPPNAGMQLDVITISSSKIENELTKHGIESSGQPVKLTVSATKGTFTVRDQSNQLHIGSAVGTTYTHTFTYGVTPVTSNNPNSGSDSCKSSDPTVACECPTGQTFSVNPKGELECVDLVTGEPTGDQPKSNPDNKATENPQQPHCEIQSDGSVIAFGQVSVDDPNCELLFGGGSGDTKQCGQFTVPKEFNCTGSGDTIEDNINDDNTSGSTGSNPIYNCEKAFGSQFCAFAEDPSNFFGNGSSSGELDLTIIGILLAIIVIIVAIAVALRSKKRSYSVSY